MIGDDLHHVLMSFLFCIHRSLSLTGRLTCSVLDNNFVTDTTHWWGSPDRGKVPLGWTLSPALVELGPVILNYIARTRSANDDFVGAPSGLGSVADALVYVPAPVSHETFGRCHWVMARPTLPTDEPFLRCYVHSVPYELLLPLGAGSSECALVVALIVSVPLLGSAVPWHHTRVCRYIYPSTWATDKLAEFSSLTGTFMTTTAAVIKTPYDTVNVIGDACVGGTYNPGCTAATWNCLLTIPLAVLRCSLRPHKRLSSARPLGMLWELRLIGCCAV